MRSYLFYTLLFFVVLVSCKTEKNRNEISFYYWKTDFSISSNEQQVLSSTGCKLLYLRLFDVDKVKDSLVPLGIVSNLKNIPDSIELIPVVFITNRSFINISDQELDKLASRVSIKIDTLLIKAEKKCTEIQIDCDWSEKTREPYFSFLKKLKGKTGKLISATIRLHQVKYPMRTGIPPADKGMFMFYNIGDIQSGNSVNSIFNYEDAKKYIDYIGFYKLHLDIALPLFSWQLYYSEGKLTGIINKEEMPDSSVSHFIRKIGSGRSEIILPFLHKGHYYKKGDILKTESVSNQDLLKAAELLAGHLNRTEKRRIVFFDLDEINFNTHSNEEIKSIVACFN